VTQSKTGDHKMVKHQNTTSRYVIDSIIYENRILGDIVNPETNETITGVRFTLEHLLVLCVVGNDYEYVVWDLATHTNEDGTPHDEYAWHMRTFHGRYFEVFNHGKKAENMAIDCYAEVAWGKEKDDEYRYLEKMYIENKIRKNIRNGKKYFEDILEVRKLENLRVKKVLTN
tara:strand:+ start:862 stop:1377 length:516 start_codon:yes stop_codon:yes gene_type:complete